MGLTQEKTAEQEATGLTQEAIDTLNEELIAVRCGAEDPRYFTHYEFIACHQHQQLNRLAELVPEGSTPETAAWALNAMKTPDEHQVVLQRALRQLLDEGTPVLVVTAEEASKRLVALFPLST